MTLTDKSFWSAQLGYLVWIMEWSVLTVRSLAFILQSSEHSAAYLESRVASFVDSATAKLVALGPDDFASRVCSAFRGMCKEREIVTVALFAASCDFSCCPSMPRVKGCVSKHKFDTYG